MPGHPSAQEKLYFAANDAARRQQLREEFEQAAKRLRKTAAALGTDDAAIVERIQALGFTGDLARVFPLLPLVHISWADGKVQRGERAVILRLCEARGIEPGTRPFMLMESLLEDRPSEDFLEETLALVRRLLAARGESTSDVIDLCHRVADASGGLLGVGARISEQERALMEHVAETLGETAQARFREKLGAPGGG